MKQNFVEIRKSLLFERVNLRDTDIIAVNGCCYGKCQQNQKDYLKLCGQAFWEFISGDEELYIKIIEPLGHQAKAKNEAFLESYAQIINQFALEFGQRYCHNGKIDWTKLIQLISSKNRVKN